MELIWSDFAIRSLKQVFDYYKEHVSLKVAHKIRLQILNATEQLVDNPELGQIEEYLFDLSQNHRYLLTGNYKVIYRIFSNIILINDVFDVRRSPNTMLKR